MTPDHDYQEKRRIILNLLRSLEIDLVEMEFWGGGDDGAVEEISVPDETLDPPVGDFTSLHDALSDFAFAVIGQAGHWGWENNDGGSGTVTLDAVEGKVRLDMSVNFMTSEHHQHEL